MIASIQFGHAQVGLGQEVAPTGHVHVEGHDCPACARAAAASQSAPGQAPANPGVVADFSPAGRAVLQAARGGEQVDNEDRERLGELSEEEKAQLEKLEARDREVRAHEQAHLGAAGDLAVGGPSYTFERGPDGQQYAVGGEVSIRTPEGDTPEETIRLAEQAARAALAPANPSGQDRSVAAAARQRAAEARAELASQKAEELQPDGETRETRGAEPGGEQAERTGFEEARRAYGAEPANAIGSFLDATA